MDKQKFSLTARIRSFSYAIRGIGLLVRNEHNARIHLAATILVVAGAIYLEFSAIEWIAILFAVGLVFAAEAFNSAIESLCDYACQGERDPKIGLSKDFAAAGVLICAIVAAAIGLILFVPKILA